MTNEERRFALKTLTSLYSQSDFHTAVQHMPKENVDVDGVRFQAYFDFLQSLYALRGDYMLLEEFELAERIEIVKSQAKEFGFPTNSLDVL